MEIFKNSI